MSNSFTTLLAIIGVFTLFIMGPIVIMKVAEHVHDDKEVKRADSSSKRKNDCA